MTAAQVADVIRKRFERVAVAPDDLPPAVCREIPALAPRAGINRASRRKSRLEAGGGTQSLDTRRRSGRRRGMGMS